MNEAKEREAFEKAHKLLDLEKKSDSWGQLVYVRSHIDSIWCGWKARAALAQPEWLKTGTMSVDEMRCIQCGEWRVKS